MRRLRQHVESGGFPLKRVGAAGAVLVVVIVALVLWTLPNGNDEEVVETHGAIVCLPEEDADESSETSADGTASSSR